MNKLFFLFVLLSLTENEFVFYFDKRQQLLDKYKQSQIKKLYKNAMEELKNNNLLTASQIYKEVLSLDNLRIYPKKQLFNIAEKSLKRNDIYHRSVFYFIIGDYKRANSEWKFLGKNSEVENFLKIYSHMESTLPEYLINSIVSSLKNPTIENAKNLKSIITKLNYNNPVIDYFISKTTNQKPNENKDKQEIFNDDYLSVLKFYYNNNYTSAMEKLNQIIRDNPQNIRAKKTIKKLYNIINR